MNGGREDGRRKVKGNGWSKRKGKRREVWWVKKLFNM